MYIVVYRYMIRSMHRLSVCESMHLSNIPLCMQCVCNPPNEVSFYCSICTTLNSSFPIFTNCEHLMDFKLKRHLFAIFATYTAFVLIHISLVCIYRFHLSTVQNSSTKNPQKCIYFAGKSIEMV